MTRPLSASAHVRKCQRLAATLALTMLATSCGAATLTVRATMPTLGDAGVCGASVLRDSLYAPLWLHVRYAGPRGAELVRHDCSRRNEGRCGIFRTCLDDTRL